MRTRRHSSVPAAVGTLCNDDAEWLAAVAQLTAPMPPTAPDAGPRGVRRFAHRRIQSASHGCSRFTLFGMRFAARPSDGASEPRSHRGATGEARQNTRLGARQADSQAPRRCARAGGKETNRTLWPRMSREVRIVIFINKADIEGKSLQQADPTHASQGRQRWGEGQRGTHTMEPWRPRSASPGASLPDRGLPPILTGWLAAPSPSAALCCATIWDAPALGSGPPQHSRF